MRPIAIQMYSVRDAAQSDLASTLDAVKGFGYDGVELAGLYGNTPKEVATLLARRGLEPVSAHVMLDEMRADFDRVLTDYAFLGCKNIVIPWISENDRPSSVGYADTLSDIRRFAERASSKGIRLHYHNHSFEFEKNENGIYALDELYSSVPETLLGAQLDVCWVAYAGEDAVKYIKKYASRINLLHLKDFVFTDGGYQFRPVGYGCLDFKAIIDSAEDCGVEWFIVEQDEPSMGKTSLESAEMSIKHIKSL